MGARIKEVKTKKKLKIRIFLSFLNLRLYTHTLFGGGGVCKHINGNNEIVFVLSFDDDVNGALTPLKNKS